MIQKGYSILNVKGKFLRNLASTGSLPTKFLQRYNQDGDEAKKKKCCMLELSSSTRSVENRKVIKPKCLQQRLVSLLKISQILAA